MTPHSARQAYRSRRPLTALALVLCGCGAVAGVAPQYKVTDLGNIFVTGVNDSGWVSGYDGRALLWQPDAGLIDLGTFAPCVGACSNRANAINNVGQVVGFTYSPDLLAYRAFVWQAGTGLIDLGDLPAGGNTSRADAINDFGLAAGRGGGQFNLHPTYGFLSFNHATAFAAGGAVLDLEPTTEATLNSIGRGINNQGTVVGERETSQGWRAMVWTTDGQALNLGGAWGLGGTGENSNSFARDINNDGWVALQLPLGDGASTAAVWREAAGFTAIDLLPGASSASANALNDDGVVVGTAGIFGISGTRAWAWSFDDGLIDLSSRLDPDTGDGWTIMDATGLSENGFIVGRAYSSTLGYRSVLLTPVPEPSAMAMLTAGLAILSLLGWRRRVLHDGSGGRTWDGAGPHTRA